MFWLGVGDTALRIVSWTGAGLAVLLVVGIAPPIVLFLLWALYLSLSIVGQDFLSFQWDALLLEAGLLSLLWAPMQWLPARTEPEPSPAARWLLVFLVFKLMFLSGATKLLSGDPTWASGTALDYHFETQPLPAWTAWYAHHLPEIVHRIMTFGSLATELVLPCLLLLPGHLPTHQTVGGRRPGWTASSGLPPQAATDSSIFSRSSSVFLCSTMRSGVGLSHSASRYEKATLSSGIVWSQQSRSSSSCRAC